MRYIAFIIEFLFGCHHYNLSRVFTINRHTYCVCCDCGAEFDYSLDTMSIRPQNISQVWTLGGDQLKNAVERI